MQNQKNIYKDLRISEACQYGKDSRRGLTGIYNHGNTCYMNSGL